MRFPCRAVVAGFGLSLTTGTAFAAEVCARAPDLVALQVAALQQQLMVAALTCDDVSLYNSFVITYQKDLVASDEALQAFFDRFGSEEGAPAYHSFKTKMANLYSARSAADKRRFCTRARAAFGPTLKAEKVSLATFAMSQPSPVNEPYTNCGTSVAGGAMVTKTPVAAPPPPPSNLLTAQNAAAEAKGAAVAAAPPAQTASTPLSAGLSTEAPAKAVEQAAAVAAPAAVAAAAPAAVAAAAAPAAAAAAAPPAAVAAAAPPAPVAAAGANGTPPSNNSPDSNQQPATTSPRSQYYTGYGVGYARERERLAQQRETEQANGSTAANSAAAADANRAPSSNGPVANSNSNDQRSVTRSARRSASEAYRERLAQQRAARQRAAERPPVRYRDRYDGRGYFWPADPYWQYCYTRYGVRMSCAEAAQRFRANQFYYRAPYDAWSYPSR
jgi:hypothetical protein